MDQEYLRGIDGALGQTHFPRHGHGLNTAVHAELFVDMARVDLHRGNGEEQLLRNLRIGEATGHEP